MKRIVFVAALLVAPVGAQDVEPPEPAADAGAWSLSVHTTGGFTGRGVGSVVVTSDGQLNCAPAACETRIPADRLTPVSTSIASIIDTAWIRRQSSGLCRDCVQTTIVLKRRDADTVRISIASWDDSQPVTPELRELRRLALALRASRP